MPRGCVPEYAIDARRAGVDEAVVPRAPGGGDPRGRRSWPEGRSAGASKGFGARWMSLSCAASTCQHQSSPRDRAVRRYFAPSPKPRRGVAPSRPRTPSARRFWSGVRVRMADCETAVKTYVVVRRHRARKPKLAARECRCVQLSIWLSLVPARSRSLRRSFGRSREMLLEQ